MLFGFPTARIPLLAALALVTALSLPAHPIPGGQAGAVHSLEDGNISEILARLEEQPYPGASKEADINLKQLNVVIDMPWRVQLRKGGTNYIPVLYFFPETKKDWRRIQVTRMRLLEPHEAGETLLWEDTADGKPVTGRSPTLGFDGSKISVVDPFGRVTSDSDIVKAVVPSGDPGAPWTVSEINDENRGFHVVLRLPVPDFGDKHHQATAVLIGQVEYKRLGASEETVYSVRRKHSVCLDTDGFPSFDGWRYYDTHLHTCAEYDTDTSIKAIRKSYGGPIQMLKESAYAIGMIDAIDKAKHRVITTDHNCFYSDDQIIKAGPSAKGAFANPITVEHPEFTPYFREKNGKIALRGQKEYENYLDEFGITTGEEITLYKQGGFLGLISGTLGSHMLTYSSRHFMGPFHGGRFFIYKNEENPNPLAVVLESMAADLNFKRGFAYAAHPFSESDLERNLLSAFNEKEVEIALKGEFIRRINGVEKDYVFKGFQGWNGKASRSLSTNTILPDRTLALLEDPTWHKDWQKGDPNWDDNLQYGLSQWHTYLCRSLSIATSARPDTKFIRKFFFSGGTDAHGDFNRDSGLLARGLTALPAQLMRFLKIFSMSDNAFGRVRTYVDSTGLLEGERLTAEERALRAFAHGHSIITDGPIINFALDANANFDSRPETMQWHPEPVFENEDGRIGGDGNMDGSRTMLVAENSPNVMFRYRWKGASDFGGKVTRIEIYKDDAGGKAELITVQRNTGEARVLKHQGELDPEAPVDASGWRNEMLGQARRPGEPVETPITVPCAISLGAFTERHVEPPFDYRAYTNPIWAVPVRLNKSVVKGAGPTLPPGSLVLTVQFPVSMKPGAYEMRMLPLDERGRSYGKGIPLLPVAAEGRVEGWGKNVRHGIANSIFSVTNAQSSVDLSSTQVPGTFCVYLKDPVDCHENRLNTVAWLVDLSRP